MEFAEPVEKRLAPYFQKAGVIYPPSRMAFVAIKDARKLELWAANEYEDLRFIREYDILAASGVLGPETARRRPTGAGRCLRDRAAESEQPLSPFAPRQLSEPFRPHARRRGRPHRTRNRHHDPRRRAFQRVSRGRRRRRGGSVRDRRAHGDARDSSHHQSGGFPRAGFRGPARDARVDGGLYADIRAALAKFPR